ncbi:MAG: magnesium transporter [Robiginitomaculum sp.]
MGEPHNPELGEVEPHGRGLRRRRAESDDLAALKDAVQSGDAAQLHDIVDKAHEADFADQLEQLSAEQREAVVALSPELISPDVLSELEDEVLEDVLPLLGDAQISSALVELDSDEATQVLEELDEHRREAVLAALPARDRADIEASLTFDEDTAGRLMQREFVAAPAFWNVGQVIDHMRAQGDNLPELFFNLYVIDAAFKPIGYVPISLIMRNGRSVGIESIVQPLQVLLSQDMDQEDVAYEFEKYHLISAPVVDEAGRLSGMITVDDVVDIIQDENKEDMLALAGVNEAGLTDTALSTVRARAPWLFVNLLTAILASFVISAFGFAIKEFVQLAILMPIVASMGGNAGTQTLAVAVRALAERDLTSANALRAVRREALAAVFNGLIFATALAIITYIWFGRTDLALVIFIAMIINHIFAGLAGILVPLGLKRFGADPAVSSSVFVTTVTDVVGFLAFLGTAALLLF